MQLVAKQRTPSNSTRVLLAAALLFFAQIVFAAHSEEHPLGSNDTTCQVCLLAGQAAAPTSNLTFDAICLPQAFALPGSLDAGYRKRNYASGSPRSPPAQPHHS